MPLRTCLGCRLVREKAELLRLVSENKSLRPDFRGALKGRGAYICPEKVCAEEALKRKDSFSRALRDRVKVPGSEELISWVLRFKQLRSGGGIGQGGRGVEGHGG